MPQLWSIKTKTKRREDSKSSNCKHFEGVRDMKPDFGEVRGGYWNLAPFEQQKTIACSLFLAKARPWTIEVAPSG